MLLIFTATFLIILHRESKNFYKMLHYRK